MATNNKSNFRPDGNLDVQGNLTVRGNILGYGTTTFLNDTVTVNDADGYVINSDSDVDSSYLQLNSQTSNARITYNSANLTIGDATNTNNILLNANSNIEGTLTTTGNVTGPYFVGIATSAQKFTGNVALTLDGDLTGSVSFEGPFTDSFAANINANAVILDYHTQGAYVKTAQGLSNSNIIVASQGADDGQNITIDLVDTSVTAGTYSGNATATAGFTVDEKGRLSQANATMIAIPSSQVTDFQARVRGNVSATTGLTYTEATGVFNITDTITGASHGSATAIPTFTVNPQGQLTAAADVNIAIPHTQVTDFDAGISGYLQNGTYVTETSGVLDVTADVVTTDRNDTLGADYTFTGTVDLTGATATTVSGTLPSVSGNAYVQGSNDGSIANTSYVETAITNLRTSLTDGATDSLNTLGELATALSNNSNVASAITTQIAAAEANILSGDANVTSYVDTNKVDKIFKIATDGSILPRHKLANGTVIDSTHSSMSNTQIDSNVITFQSSTGTSEAKADIFFQTQKFNSPYAVLHTGQQNVSGKISTLNSNGTTMTVATPSAHRLVTGDTITIQNTSDTQAHGSYIITKTGLNTFTVPNTNTFSATGNADGNGATPDYFDPNPTADFQKRDGNITYTGQTRFMSGRRANFNSDATIDAHTIQHGSKLGSGDVVFLSNITIQKDGNTTNQSHASNVTTLFFKEEIGVPSYFGGTSSGIGISSANIFTFAHSSDVTNRNADSYSGTINSQVSANTIEIGSPRASRATFEDSVMFVGGDIQTYINAQTVTANAGADVYTVGSPSTSFGDGLIERLTVDGAITLGNKVSDTYHANGTIYYDTGTNQFMGVEAGVPKTLVDATVNTISLGSADVGSDANLMTQASNVFFPAGVKGNYGITVSRIANATANVAVIETSNADIRGLFSTSAGSQGYNNGTGVISVPGTTDHITEGTNLFYTDERVDDRVGALIVGGSNITATYNDGAGTLTIDADLTGDVTSVVAGAGLITGGTSGDITLDIGAGTGISVNANDVAITNTGVTAATYGSNASTVSNFTVNAQGQLTGAANQAIAITADQVTDFSEAVDDRVNVLVSGGSNITVTYDDGAGTFVIDNDLSGDVTGVVAGAGMTGGGSSGDLTLDVVGGTGITVNADNIQVAMSDFNTGDLAEGTNLYYTDVRADARITNALKDEDNMASDSATHVPSQQSVKAYVDSQVASKDALSELSGDTDDITEGTSNLYFTNERVDDRVGALIVGGANITATYNDGAGTLTIDADNVGDVTGVTAGTGLTGGGSSGDLTLNVIGGDGITANADDITVDNTVVRTTGTKNIGGAKTFTSDLILSGNLTVNGTQTTVNTETLTVDDNIIVLNNNEAGTPSQNAGIEIERGTSTNVQLRFNETSDQWEFTNDGSSYVALGTSGIFTGDTDGVSEGSTNLYFTPSRARGNISVTDAGGDGSLAYNSTSGVITYTGPSAAEVRAHLSGSSGVNYDSSTGAITGDTAEIRGMISASGDISYDSSTGVISFTNDAGDIESVTAGSGMTGGGTSGAVTLNVIGGDGITANADDIAVDLTDTAIFTSTNTASKAVVRDGSGNFAAGVVTATATAARYADLAENYLADKPYDAGTVLVIGGSEEVTEVTKQNAPNLAGVVSTDPAYLMNSTLEGDNVVTVALRGRVPVKVTGAVRKGDVLIASNTPGHAEAAPFRGYHVSGPSMIGIAISEHLSSGTGVVEAQIK